MGATGKNLEDRYLHPWPQCAVWSSFIWPTEQPTSSDFILWRTTLWDQTIHRCNEFNLGKFINPTHRAWTWIYCPDSDTLLNTRGDWMDIYTKSQVERFSRRGNQYTRSRIDIPNTATGHLASINSVAPGVIRILGTFLPKPPLP